VVPGRFLQAKRCDLESKNGRIRRSPIRIRAFPLHPLPKTNFPFRKAQKEGTARPSFVSTLLEPHKLSLDASSDSTDHDEPSSSDHDSFSSSHNTKAPRDTTTDDHDI
jgi:hypothetical protein